MNPFELRPWNRGISNDELIADIRRVASFLEKRSITGDEYDKNGKCRARTVEVRFGGWNNALRAAGLEVKRKYLTEVELFENLREVWIKLGHQPTGDNLRDKAASGSKFGRNTYAKRFGSWRKALEAFVAWANGDEDSNESVDIK